MGKVTIRLASAFDWMLLAAMVFLLSGCSPSGKDDRVAKNPPEGREEMKRDHELSVAQARAALIILVESLPADSLAARTLPDLEADKEQVIEGGWVSIGRWECNIALKRFAIHIEFGEVLESFQGRFSRDTSGTWKAIIEEQIQS